MLNPLRDIEESKGDKILASSGRAGTLLEKMGGQDGINTFADKVMKKVLEDPGLKDFFKDVNHTLYIEKFRYFITFLVGGYEHWNG